MWLLRRVCERRIRAAAERSGRSLRRDVLLLAQGDLTAFHLAAVYETLRGDRRLRFTLAGSGHLSARRARVLARRLGLPSVGPVQAAGRFWDLILVADHNAVRPFHPAVPAVKINHSIAAGKLVGGRPYRHGPHKILRRDGSLAYRLVLEPSEFQRELAVLTCPALAGRVAVVGDLWVDRLSRLALRREVIRAELGLRRRERAVLICSTWGPASLFSTIGQELLAEAERLTRALTFRFIVCVHPHVWSGSRRHRRKLEKLRDRGFIVTEPGAWEAGFVAADVGLFDHTSLSVMFATLERPMAFVTVDRGAILPRSLVEELYLGCPRLERTGALGALLESCQEPDTAVLAVSAAACSHRGRAAERIREVITEVLGLTPETPPPAGV